MVYTTHKNGKTMGMVDPIGLRTLTCASQVYLGVLLFREIHYDSLDGPGTLLKGVMTNTPWPWGHEAHLWLEQLKQRKHTCITCCNPSKTVKFHLTLNFARSYWLGALPQHPQPSTKRSLLCSRTLRTKPWRNLENYGSCDHVGIMAAVGRKPWATWHGAS